jgi:hypothetical protein
LNVKLIATSNDLLLAEVVENTKDHANVFMSKARNARKTFKDNLASYECKEYLKMSIERAFPDTSLNPLGNPERKIKLSKQNLILSERFGTLYYKK